MNSPIGSLVRGKLLPVFLIVFFQAGLNVTANTATVNFPSSIDFHLEATSDTPIETAEIEVRTGALSCGGGTTRAAPDDFTPGKSIEASWTWELRQTGALPPGTVITWAWILHTEDGQTITTPSQEVTVEDDTHTWQGLETDELRLNWYNGDEAFAKEIQAAAEEGMKTLQDTLGVTDDEQIHVYLYADPEDMKDATLYAPGWSGGLAFSAENALLLAVGKDDLDWGKRAIKHELTHVIVDRHTHSCINSTPSWFEEGLAMYFEGPPDADYSSLLDGAITSDDLLSVRELGSSFSGDSSLASLSYAQSASLVRFLVDTYGNDKLLELLDQWKQGSSQDKALTAVYGFDRDGLEAEWRESVGAAPMKALPSSTRAEPTPYPTYIPLDGAPLAATEIRPTPAYLNEAPPGAAGSSSNPDSYTDPMDYGPMLIFAAVACGTLLLAMVGAVVFFLIIRRAMKPPQPPAMS